VRGPAPALLSVAVMVKGNEPAAAGVPDSSPAVLRVNPVGKAPLLTAKVYGATPPAAEMAVCGYGVPSVPVVRAVGKTASGITCAGTTVNA